MTPGVMPPGRSDGAGFARGGGGGQFSRLASAAAAAADVPKVYRRSPDQGLTLAHFSAQLEPFLTQNTP